MNNVKEYSLAVKKYEVMKLVGKWMELETIILSQVARTEKTNITVFFSHVNVASEFWVFVFHKYINKWVFHK